MPVPPLLVLTATLGRSRLLDETVADVVRLATEIPLRHVLVAPEPRVAELSRRLPETSVVAEAPGGGFYAALNGALAGCGGWRGFTWINDDDRLHPGFGDLVRKAFAAGDTNGIWYGEVDYLDETGTPLARMPVCRSPRDVRALLAAGVAPFTQQGALIGRDAWARAGGFDPAWRIAGDFDFWVRAAAAGARFHFVPALVAGFRIRPGQLSGDVAAAAAEVSAVLRRGDDPFGRGRRWLAVFRFRVANAARIVARVRRTGRLRSRGIFAR